MYSKSNNWPFAVRLGVVAILAACTMVSGRSAAKPQPYGEYFLRLDDLASVQREAVAADPGNPSDFESQMEELELDAGPYADGLAEPLGSLGRYYRQEGDHEQALRYYRRALHIVRINDGLYSERQVPLLREMLATFRDTGDYEALDLRYEYLFRLYGAGQPPYNDMRLRVALEYLRWQREALRMKLGGDGAVRVLDAIDLNDEILEAMAESDSVAYEWRRKFAFNQLRNLYILRDRFQASTHENGLGNSRDIFGVKPITEDLQDQRLKNLASSAQSKARVLAEKLREAAVREGPVAEAELELALADWYFWNGQRSKAGATYTRVAEILRGAGELELLEEWMGRPVELPEEGAFWVGRRRAEATPAEVRASFNVSSRGRVSDLQVEALSGDAEGQLSRFKRYLSATLFRPRWDSGEPESVEGVVREYQLLQ